MRHIIIALVLFTVGHVAAENVDSIDALPHRTMVLPNQTTIELLKLNDTEYKRITTDILSGKVPDGIPVCVEIRFGALTPDGRIALLDSTGLLVAESSRVLQKAKELKNGDNISAFGTLRVGSNGRDVELALTELFKESSDLQRLRASKAALEKRAGTIDVKSDDAETLAQDVLALGNRAVRAAGKKFVAGNDNFELGALATSAFTLGLELKESAIKARRPDDADSYYVLGVQYHELLRNNVHKFKDSIKQCLELDPAHPGAGQLAEQHPELDLHKFESRWYSAAKIEEILAVRAERDRALKMIEEEHALAVHNHIEAEGPILSKRIVADLASEDTGRSAAALEFYADILDLEPAVGAPLVSAISELDHPNALTALKLASRTKQKAIRALAYEALVWRSNRAQEREQTLSLLCDALKVEKDTDTTKSGVDALVSRGDKSAIGALVCSLSSDESDVRTAVMAGLHTATHESFKTPADWDAWWKKNQ